MSPPTRGCCACMILALCHFNPPAPCGAGRYATAFNSNEDKFQSTRPVWGGTFINCLKLPSGIISIHPPRVGRDRRTFSASWIYLYFNPPAPCGAGLARRSSIGAFSDFNPPAPCGAGHVIGLWQALHKIFQSTRPVWGGTLSIDQYTVNKPISIHPPRVGRDELQQTVVDPLKISIHPPRVGRDPDTCAHM